MVLGEPLVQNLPILMKYMRARVIERLIQRSCQGDYRILNRLTSLALLIGESAHTSVICIDW